MASRIWTIGYEGRDLDGLVEALRDESIERVIDVRERAQSRKRGLSKTPLSEALEQAGIQYENRRDLGVPKSVRDPYKAGGPFEALAEWYAGHLDEVPDAVDAVVQAARDERVCLLCYEADPAQCHRGVLAERLGNRGLRARHL